MISDEAHAAQSGAVSKMSEVAEQAKEKARHIGQQAREFGEHARDVASEKMHEARDRAGEAFEHGKIRAKAMEREFEGYVQDYPLQSLLIAAGAGLVLGFLLRGK